MKRDRLLISLSLPLVTFAASATKAQNPNYLDLMDTARKIAVMSTSIKSCEHFGYTTDPKGVDALVARTVQKATFEGIDRLTAQRLIGDALKSEMLSQEGLVDDLQNNPNDEELASSYFASWRERCDNLAEDPLSAAYFKK